MNLETLIMDLIFDSKFISHIVHSLPLLASFNIYINWQCLEGTRFMSTLVVTLLTI